MAQRALSREQLEIEAALRSLDMQWARRAMAAATDDHVRLMAMHKMRYESVRMPAELRLASAAWLREHGCNRVGGLPLLPEGELPA